MQRAVEKRPEPQDGLVQSNFAHGFRVRTFAFTLHSHHKSKPTKNTPTFTIFFFSRFIFDKWAPRD